MKKNEFEIFRYLRALELLFRSFLYPKSFEKLINSINFKNNDFPCRFTVTFENISMSESK